MGGGGGKAPDPKTFVAPPIDNSPATNPIPNFFLNRAPQQQSPYQQFGQGGMMPHQSPFGGGQDMSKVIAALLEQIRKGRG